MDDDRDCVRWSAWPEGVILWQEFDDESVIMNGLSGETHFLNITAAEILKLLQERPRTIGEILDGIAVCFDLEEEPALAQQVNRVVQEFEQIGLVCSSRP